MNQSQWGKLCDPCCIHIDTYLCLYVCTFTFESKLLKPLNLFFQMAALKLMERTDQSIYSVQHHSDQWLGKPDLCLQAPRPCILNADPIFLPCFCQLNPYIHTHIVPKVWKCAHLKVFVKKSLREYWKNLNMLNILVGCCVESGCENCLRMSPYPHD